MSEAHRRTAGKNRFFLFCLYGLLLVCCSAASGQERSRDAQPWLLIRKVGPVHVEAARRARLESPVAELFGEILNYRAGVLVALWKLADQDIWHHSDRASPEPGGVFRIPRVQFPQPGDYQLVVALFPPDAAPTEGEIGSEWALTATAVSPEVAVSVQSRVSVSEAPKARLKATEPIISIAQIASAALDADQTTVVPSSGDVLVDVGRMPVTYVYLVIHVPYTDRAFVYGPGRRSKSRDLYVLHSVSLEVPGDPQNSHLELIALASAAPVPTGPVSWEALRHWDIIASPTFDVIVVGQRPRSDPERVPFIAITRLGEMGLGSRPTMPAGAPGRPGRVRAQVPARAEPSAAPFIRARQGEFIEVEHYQRVPEGARIWILTRPMGSSLWLAQGPAIPRGPRSDGRSTVPAVVWVWTDLRFAQIAGAETHDFEVIAVLATYAFPNAWIDSTFLSTVRLETISAPLRLVVEDSDKPDALELSIRAVAGQRVRSNHVAPAKWTGQVEVDVPMSLPRGTRIYVGKHLDGSPTWTFTETISDGSGYVAPDILLGHPVSSAQPPLYQLIAIATRGTLPALEFEYSDFIRHAMSLSQIVTVRPGAAPIQELVGWLFPRLSAASSASTGINGGTAWVGVKGPATTAGLPAQGPAQGTANNSSSPPAAVGPQERDARPGWLRLLWAAFVLGTLVVLIWLERMSGGVSQFAGRAAGTAERVCAYGERTFHVPPPPKLDLAYLLLGLTILFTLLYVITNFYLVLYSRVIREVTALSQRESEGLAVWIVLITALLGVCIDLARRFSREVADTDQVHERPFFRRIMRLCMVVAVILWVFQGGMYFQMLDQQAKPGLVPPLGGLAAVLISATETIAFFFVTLLTLPALAWLLFQLALMPFYALLLLSRCVQWAFKAIPAISTERPPHVRAETPEGCP